MTRKPHTGVIGSSFLTRIEIDWSRVTDADEHPFNLRSIARGLPLQLSRPITMLVGENGAGKSTLLEALAWACGFDHKGGDRCNSYAADVDGHALGRTLQLSWRQRVADGFYLRAETLFQWIDYMESVGAQFSQYGHRTLHARSHGEAFLALFEGRFEDGLYLLDEPEAALWPILLCYPGATVLAVDEDSIQQVAARDTDHVRLTREFLNAPERYFRHLFAAEQGGEGK